MKKVFLIAAIAAIAIVARAELRQDTATYIGRSNATAAVIAPLESYAGQARGFLQRVAVSVGGSGVSNELWLADSDGCVLLSNKFQAGTTTFWFTNNPPPFIGVVVSGYAAMSNAPDGAVTNTVKILYNRY